MSPPPSGRPFPPPALRAPRCLFSRTRSAAFRTAEQKKSPHPGRSPGDETLNLAGKTKSYHQHPHHGAIPKDSTGRSSGFRGLHNRSRLPILPGQWRVANAFPITAAGPLPILTGFPIKHSHPLTIFNLEKNLCFCQGQTAKPRCHPRRKERMPCQTLTSTPPPTQVFMPSRTFPGTPGA